MKLPVRPIDERDIIDNDNAFVCFANTTEARDEIVHVINSHEKLVKLLKNAQRYIRSKDPKYIEIEQTLKEAGEEQ